jgi:catalase
MTESAPPPLTSASLLLRLAAIGLILFIVLVAFAYTGGWLPPERLTPIKFTDRFEAVNGVYPGFRRNHAKGLCLIGVFDSNGQGQRLSKAVVFEPGRIPLIGRFAFAGGQPFVPDAPETVRSLALRFTLPDGEEWRTGMINIPVFPVNTPEALYELLLATRADPATGKPDPAAVKAFFGQHPESGKALAAIGAQPLASGFDNATYNGLNAFRFIDAAGRSTPVRWSMVPLQPFEAADTKAAAPPDKNYLFDALIASIAKGPLQWRLIVTLGQPGDPTNDATLAWPAEREKVDVGTLTVERLVGEGEGVCRDVNFDPTVLPAGIALSDDPLLSARSAVYAVSYERRAGEVKEPSAVKTPETGIGAGQ